MKKWFQLVLIIASIVGILIEMTSVALDESILDAILILRYFTIQSNLLVCIYFVMMYLGIGKKYRNMLGGITVYIFVTFLIFHIMLSSIWEPTGIRAIANYLLHYITPVLTVSYVVYFRHEYTFHYRSILEWMIYPCFYLAFLFIHGILTNDYIYPFFDVNETGLISVVFMTLFLVFIFVILSFILMKIVSLHKIKKND